jgi:hypothetical protein
LTALEADGIEFIGENGGEPRGKVEEVGARSRPSAQWSVNQERLHGWDVSERHLPDFCRAVKMPIRPMIVVGFVIGLRAGHLAGVVISVFTPGGTKRRGGC